jgi:predicted DNA-binding protein (MmcQ/YjbR family)
VNHYFPEKERSEPMQEDVLDRLRAICLTLPEASEQGGVGNPSFKVRDKIFAMQHGVEGRPSMWCKAPSGAQDVLVHAQPERFFVPPYVGHHGWVGVWLDITIDWEEVADLVQESYRMTAPKRLRALLDEN